MTYNGLIDVGMYLRAGDKTVRVLAPHPDGGWIIEHLSHPGGTHTHAVREMTVCPEINLRMAFDPVS